MIDNPTKKKIKGYDFYDLYRVTYHRGHNIANGEPFTYETTYSKQGDYIGELDKAQFLTNKGIELFETLGKSDVCSIGFIPKENAWAGWSHRGICTFKIGDKVKKGDCAYTKERGAWQAKNITDAKQMAMDYAEAVS